MSSPTFQIGGGGTYDDGLLFGSIAGKYVGRQYATFMNDESIPGYATLDLAIGVHLADWLDGKRTDLRINAINVTDPHVLAGVQAVTTNARDTIGRGARSSRAMLRPIISAAVRRSSPPCRAPSEHE